jgi:hypothetical protein
VNILALSDFRPEKCGSTIVRQASYNDVQALANGLPILSRRSYRIGTEQGIVVVKTAMIDRRYHWAVTLEPPIARKINNPPLALSSAAKGQIIATIEFGRSPILGKFCKTSKENELQQIQRHHNEHPNQDERTTTYQLGFLNEPPRADNTQPIRVLPDLRR